MLSKCWLQHLKVARAASVQSFKKRKIEACSIPDPAKLEINDELNTTDIIDTSDTESQSGVWYWNKSANKSDLDSEVGEEEEKEEDVEEPDREIKQPRKKISKMVLEWNQKGEDKLCGGYRKRSKSITTRKNESAWESEKQALESYSLGALWQQDINLGIMSAANSQVEFDQSSESQPIDSVFLHVLYLKFLKVEHFFCLKSKLLESNKSKY